MTSPRQHDQEDASPSIHDTEVSALLAAGGEVVSAPDDDEELVEGPNSK